MPSVNPTGCELAVCTGASFDRPTTGSAEAARPTTWRLVTPPARRGSEVAVASTGTVRVGIEYDDPEGGGPAERAEVELGVERLGDELRTLAPGTGRLLARFPGGIFPLEASADHLVDVEVSATA